MRGIELPKNLPMVATRTFTFTHEGQREEAVRGQTRIYSDSHPVVLAHPDCWRKATPEEARNSPKSGPGRTSSTN
jgi:hypothetical protein